MKTFSPRCHQERRPHCYITMKTFILLQLLTANFNWVQSLINSIRSKNSVWEQDGIAQTFIVNICNNVAGAHHDLSTCKRKDILCPSMLCLSWHLNMLTYRYGDIKAWNIACRISVLLKGECSRVYWSGNVFVCSFFDIIQNINMCVIAVLTKREQTFITSVCDASDTMTSTNGDLP